MTETLLAADADPTMPFASSESGKNRTTRYILKGRACSALPRNAFHLTRCCRYVEMLEHQQTQLILGLQEMYKRSSNGQRWEGPLLDDSAGGKPLIHDILDRLGVLQLDAQGHFGNFEEDPEAMQQRLVSEGAGLVQRRASLESDYERDSSQPSFFELNSQPSSVTSAFHTQQLPTPPMHSPGMAQSVSKPPQPWGLPTQKATQVRPQSLQIHPGYTSWDTGMNPAVLQGSHWMDSPASYDTNMTYLEGNAYPEFPSVDGNVPMPDWNDEVFNSYLNTTAA